MPTKFALLTSFFVLAACAMGGSDVQVAEAARIAPKPIPLIRANATRVVPETRADITLSFAPVVKQAAPAVVNIYTKKVVERRASPFMGDPFFERFFQDMFPKGPRQRIENSLGSGVILDPSGIVVSNHHVVAGADQITVILADRREFKGKVIFADKESDLAVVQLDGASGLPTLSLRDSDSLEVGDLVLAIGNPFGVGQTVTSGIISALARARQGRKGGPGFFIQTDAPINPGNSGGALVDMEGRLVGVNTAILSRSGGSNGIGFAVPSDLVATVVNSARAGQTELVRPWLGIEGQEVGGELASALGLDAPRGVLIEDLHPQSPLAAAGLERGDVIVDLDGEPVNALEELDFRVATKPLETSVSVGHLRDGERRTATLRLAVAPEEPARDQRLLSREDGLPGAAVVNINPAVIEETGLSMSAEGILVLDARGAAKRIGLRKGDLIREVNGTKVADVAALVSQLTATTGMTELAIERRGRVGTLRYRR